MISALSSCAHVADSASISAIRLNLVESFFWLSTDLDEYSITDATAEESKGRVFSLSQNLLIKPAILNIFSSFLSIS